MREIDLSELPALSRWPARLLGIEPFDVRVRDLGQIEREYNQDKYDRCLKAYRDNGEDPTTLHLFAAPGGGERDGVDRGRVVAMAEAEMGERFFAALTDALRGAIAGSRTIVELGCAFGSNLRVLADRFPGKTWLGGDWSDNAIALAAELHAERPEIRVGKLNFYETPYPCLDEAEAPVTVFTSAAIEQLPSVEPVLDALAGYRDKIAHVVHLEPAHDLHGNDLIDLMRRRYAQLNDYNRDLISALERRPDIRIERIEPQVFGFNAFNPLSIVEWSYR